jgi:hypothetical protein
MPNTYVRYLEAVVLSLLAERPEKFKDIVCVDDVCSCLDPMTFSPLNIFEEIDRQRKARDGSS